MAKQAKSPVTTRALIQRLNRHLAAAGEKLVKARGANAAQQLGDYYTVTVSDSKAGQISAQDVDLEKMARALGVLKPYEEVKD